MGKRNKTSIRIKEMRLDNGWTQKDLANKLGLKNDTAIANYEAGYSIPKDEIKLRICEIFNCSMDYLMGLTNIRKPINGLNISNLKEEEKSINPYNNKLYLCPLYGRISAGQPNWAEDCLEGYLPIDYNLMNISSPEECYFLQVNGESMNKVVKNGAYALIRKTDFVEDGEIAVVLVNGYDATLKKFSKQGDFILLEPESTDNSFKTQIYDKNTPIKIIGKYIGKMEINN